MAEKQKRVDLGEIGLTGLKRYGGFVNEEFLRELSGTKAIEVYREMRDNDATVGAMMFAISMLMRQVNWRVKPVSKDNVDVEAADFLESCRNDMSMTWNDLISEIAEAMLPYGFAPHEIVYKKRMGESQDGSQRSKYDDGRIGWRKLPARSPDSLYEWKFDETGGVQAMVQQCAPDFKTRTIPIQKMCLFRSSTIKNNPEGRSVLRNAYRAWYYKKHIENIEGIGIERDLAGLPMAMVPPQLLAKDASPADKALLEEIKRVVTNVRRDEQEGIIIPAVYDENNNKLFDFKLLSTGGTRQFDTDKTINRYDQRIAMCVMADFILMGQDKVGSFALADSKTNLFTVALGAWLDMIAEVLNRHAVPRLFAFNTFKVKALPQFEHGDVETVDLEALGNYVRNLTMSGMNLFPDKAAEKYLKDQAGIPMGEGTEE